MKVVVASTMFNLFLFAILLQCAEAGLQNRLFGDDDDVDLGVGNLFGDCDERVHNCGTDNVLKDFCRESCKILDDNPQKITSCNEAEESGIYTFNVGGVQKRVVCEKDTKGYRWTVFQRRGRYGNRWNYFRKGWNDYRNGFGDPKKEFWLGLEAIHQMVGCPNCKGPYQLKITMEATNDKLDTLVLNDFKITAESDGYRLRFSNAEPANLAWLVNTHNNQKFSTWDRDQDHWPNGNCAKDAYGAWWFDGRSHCWKSNFNGIYYGGGVVHYVRHERNRKVVLKTIVMKFRSVNGNDDVQV